MQTVESADGTSIAYERTGAGPPLVLVHGGGANDHTRWELADVRPTLAEHHTVYAMDCRGRGQSGDAEAYALQREFEDVAAVVDAVGVPAALLGHSFGALLALEAALRTDNLRRLVLYEPVFAVGDRPLVDEGTLDEMATLLDADERERTLEVFLESVARLPTDEVDALRSAPNWPDRVAAAHTTHREAVGIADYAFDPGRYSSLTVRTLCLAGSESPPLYREATRAVNAALPDSRLEVFEGHGHVAMLTDTDRFIDVVTAFLGEG